MVTFTKLSNGHTLTIEVSEVSLIDKLNKDIQEMEDLKQKYTEFEKERIAAEENGQDYDDWRWEYDMSSVYGDPETDWCTPDEIIADRKDFKETIEKLIADNGETLWSMAELKKNGTFKLNCKPTIRTAINGTYYEDSYGWRTLVLRLVPVTDTRACVEFDRIVVHY